MNALFQSYGLVVASVLAGLATAVFIWSLITLIASSRSALEGSGTFERHRRQQLRGGNTIFRLFEPLVEELAGIWRRLLGTSLESLRSDLVVSCEKKALKTRCTSRVVFRAIARPAPQEMEICN